MLTQEEARKEADGTRAALQVIWHVDAPPDVEVTCESCKLNDSCWVAFDPYNTDGDCLADK